MEAFLIYIGKVALAAGVFYLTFLLLFQNQKHFVFNRIYLPVSLVLSFGIPLITFTTIKYIETTNFDVNSFAYLPDAVETQQTHFVWEWYHYLFGIYILGLVGFLFHLLIGHLKAISIVKQSWVKNLFQINVNLTKKDVHPFSFFNKIVLSEKTLDNKALEMIVAHENIHVKEKHTLDILLTELLFLLQWFNPFAWLIKDAIKNNLEYLTDHQIAEKHNPQDYQLAMVGLADKKGVAPFLNALNGSQLKNRIIMMKKKTENKYAFVKQLVVLPLLAILVMGLSNKEVKTKIGHASTKFDIVVDGKIIPNNDLAFRNVDFSKGLDGREIILALGIEDKVISNGMNIENDETNSVFFIRTTDYVSGSNPEFDRLTLSEEKEKLLAKAEATFYAVDDEIVSKANFERLGKDGFESVVVLSGNEASDKYGNNYESVVDAKTGKAKFKISSENVVKGKVTNEKGEAISSASIIIKGKTVGTISDASGNYEIKLDEENETLVFIMSGFEKQERKVEDKQEINVELKAESKTKSIEIRETGNETSSIKANEAKRNKSVIFTGELANEPLYVVDGMIVKSINNVSPDDIESIDVLKNESATKFYGEKGKNGVVLITMKDLKVNGKVPTASMNLKTDKSVQNSWNKSVVNQENPPLFVVDGKEVESIDEIDSESIESINVLKDESAVSKYGEKGKNGVIEITMKVEKITTQLEFRRFIAKNVKYPVAARENGIVGKIRVAVTFDKNGKVVKTEKSSMKYKNIDEVVVVANNPEKKPHVQNNDYEVLRKEAIRIVNLLPAVDLDNFKGNTVNVVINFTLQD